MRLLLVLLATALSTSALPAADVDYERDIKPLLMQKCSACHGALKQHAGLRLDAAALIRQGGDSGPAVAGPNQVLHRLPLVAAGSLAGAGIAEHL